MWGMDQPEFSYVLAFSKDYKMSHTFNIYSTIYWIVFGAFLYVDKATDYLMHIKLHQSVSS